MELFSPSDLSRCGVGNEEAPQSALSSARSDFCFRKLATLRFWCRFPLNGLLLPGVSGEASEWIAG